MLYSLADVAFFYEPTAEEVKKATKKMGLRWSAADRMGHSIRSIRGGKCLACQTSMGTNINAHLTYWHKEQPSESHWWVISIGAQLWGNLQGRARAKLRLDSLVVQRNCKSSVTMTDRVETNEKLRMNVPTQISTEFLGWKCSGCQGFSLFCAESWSKTELNILYSQSSALCYFFSLSWKRVL